MTGEPRPLQLFVGTYTRREPHVAGRAEGIYRYAFDSLTGELTRADTTGGIENPSFLTFNADGSRLYAASEVGDFADGTTGGIAAYSVNGEGGLTLLNHVASGGRAPCYLRVDASGGWLLVANYISGTVGTFPIGADGALGLGAALIQHVGSGPNAARQEGPHAHSINPTPDGRFAIAADLGADELIVYALDPDTGALTRSDTASTTLHPGAGPRHFEFHPNGRLAFVINELDSTLTTLDFDAGSGELAARSTVSTLPATFSGDNTCADLHIHPNGRYLYGSNRGHDSIAIFAVDDEAGSLTLSGHASTAGRTPRNFALTPDGQFLLAANQDSSTVTVFAVEDDGAVLRQIGQMDVPSPVCLCFRPLG